MMMIQFGCVEDFCPEGHWVYSLHMSNNFYRPYSDEPTLDKEE